MRVLARALLLLCGASCRTDVVGEGALPQAAPEHASPEEQRRDADVGRALALLFGQSEDPVFRVLPEWRGEGFDPNAPGGWLRADQREAVRTDNGRRYRAQLEALARGDLADVRIPPGADELEARWQVLLERRAETDADSWLSSARAAFVDHLPGRRASAALYRRSCANCHGSDGGGNGPTAAFLDPAPRDYRQGEFKFNTLLRPAPPPRADLARVIRTGITGTAMPAFDFLSAAELQGLVDHVVYLSMRGETEILLAEDWDAAEGLTEDVLLGDYRLVVERWRAEHAELAIPVPPMPSWSPERVERGRALFLSESGANCARCHGADGRGHGVAAFAAGDPGRGEAQERPLLRDDWGHPIRPRDLTTGIYRFGSTPRDNYRRIHAGIRGTPMPAHHGMWVTQPDGRGRRRLGADDIWDLVFFVRSLSASGSQ